MKFEQSGQSDTFKFPILYLIVKYLAEEVFVLCCVMKMWLAVGFCLNYYDDKISRNKKEFKY